MHEAFFIFNNRLSLFKKSPIIANTWDQRWARKDHKNTLENSKSGKLGEFEIFISYLPKHLPILEAGCGLGQLVMALDARGYQVEGIDFAEETIKRIHDLAPGLNVDVGDIYHIKKPNQFYGGYISMGVLEHNPEGPIEGLKEARRVLHQDGVAFITVPFLNVKREKSMQLLPHVNDSILRDGLHFYQYYFPIKDFSLLLNSAGFSVKALFPYAVFAGITRDYKLGRWLLNKGFFHWRLQSIISRACQNAPMFIRKKYAHMMMYICKPI